MKAVLTLGPRMTAGQLLWPFEEERRNVLCRLCFMLRLWITVVGQRFDGRVRLSLWIWIGLSFETNIYLWKAERDGAVFLNGLLSGSYGLISKAFFRVTGLVPQIKSNRRIGPLWNISALLIVEYLCGISLLLLIVILMFWVHMHVKSCCRFNRSFWFIYFFVAYICRSIPSLEK